MPWIQVLWIMVIFRAIPLNNDFVSLTIRLDHMYPYVMLVSCDCMIISIFNYISNLIQLTFVVCRKSLAKKRPKDLRIGPGIQPTVWRWHPPRQWAPPCVSPKGKWFTEPRYSKDLQRIHDDDSWCLMMIAEDWWWLSMTGEYCGIVWLDNDCRGS